MGERGSAGTGPSKRSPAFWAAPLAALLADLDATPTGLSGAAAADRLARDGPNLVAEHRGRSRLRLLVAQVESPLMILLLFACAVSAALGQFVEAAVIGAIVLAGAGLGFIREWDASRALERLQARVRLTVTARRDGSVVTIPAADLVRGDVVQLAAGSLVPADGRLLEATDLYVTEATLTGESYPVRKRPGAAAPDAPLASRLGCVFQGTSVRSGTGTFVVVATGRHTVLGAIAGRLARRPPLTAFDQGLRQFGALLTQAMAVLTLAIFAVNVLLHRPVVEALLFSIALAVGLAPELLPAILTVNLARSARAMADAGVLVRRLPAIENLGSMSVLCTDKTGTLTEGKMVLEGAVDAAGVDSERVLDLAALASALQTGIASPLDDAVLARRRPDVARVLKLGEVPYDFLRKRLSVIVREGSAARLVTKGAVNPLLGACAGLDASARADLEARFAAMSDAGDRVLALATRTLPVRAGAEAYGRDDETGLVFEGFLRFSDPPKAGIQETLASLSALGISLKIVTGDNARVARHVALAVGLAEPRVLTGADLDRMRDEALWQAAPSVDLFAELDPSQKARLIEALKHRGLAVGYLGDGINDAPALHAADVGISVEGAVDVAREAADLVLLAPDLDVLRRGVLAGRTTFANTMKYILTTESANLGNMMSMALASLFLPFLPLLASQILLNNLLSDVPALALAGDRVDPEALARPERWDARFVRRFMVGFGALSSVFDLVTFGALLLVFHTGVDRFRTAWFVESLATELLVALVVRTRRRSWRSLPGRGLLLATVAVFALDLAIPYLPGATLLGFTPLPPVLLATVAGITVAYTAAAEATKAAFFARVAGAG